MNTGALAGSTSVITTNAPSVPARVPSPISNHHPHRQLPSANHHTKSLCTTAGGGDQRNSEPIGNGTSGVPLIPTHNGAVKPQHLYRPTPTSAPPALLHQPYTNSPAASLHNNTTTTSVVSTVTSARPSSTSLPSTPSSSHSSSSQYPLSAQGSGHPPGSVAPAGAGGISGQSHSGSSSSASGSARPSPATSAHAPDTPSSDRDCDTNKSSTPLSAYSKNTPSPWGR